MSDQDFSLYPAALPQEPLIEIGPDIFLGAGTILMKPLMQVSRNMVVVRSGSALTLVNPIRLTPDGEAQLEELGTVEHAVRLGAFHGRDDPYTVARFGAQFWCQAGSDHYPDPAPDHTLTEGGALPVPDAELFVFRDTKEPECALLIRRGPGVLLTCDSLQHYGDLRRESLLVRAVMPLLGFRRDMVVGPLWLKMLTPAGGSLRPDFERLMELDFDALVSGHGTPRMHGASEAVRAAIARAKFGDD